MMKAFNADNATTRASMNPSRVVAFDYETFAFVPGNNCPPPVVMSAVASDDPRPGLFTPAEADTYLRQWLQDENTAVIGHNVAFDLSVFVEHSPDPYSAIKLVHLAMQSGRVYDTQIRAKLINIERGRGYLNTSLAHCVKRSFKHDLFESKTGDSWRTRYGELYGVPFDEWPAEARDYSIMDAVWTLRLFMHQTNQVSSTGCQRQLGIPNEGHQVRASWALRLMSMWGMRTDAEQVRALEERMSKKRSYYLGKTSTPGVYRQGSPLDTGLIRPSGTKDLGAIRALVEEAYAQRGEKPPNTNKGSTSTDRATLLEARHPTLADLAELSRYDKILNTYIPVLYEGTKRPIQPYYRVLVDSGRTSSHNPNIQNLPRMPGVRECFIAREGHVLVSCDYSSLELRTLAQVCLDFGLPSALAQAFRAGADPHLDLAADMLGISYEEAGERYRRDDKEVKEKRQGAKIANFGFPGRLGAITFVDYAKGFGVDLTLQESQALREAWFAKWPEMRPYFRYIDEMLQRPPRNTITQVRSDRVRGGLTCTSAANTFFQGLAADGAKEALWSVARACYEDRGSPLFGSRPVAFVHDEIIVEVPCRVDIHDAAYKLAALMVEAMRRWVPDVPIEAEPSAMYVWSKDAKPCFDGAGRLIPWSGEKK